MAVVSERLQILMEGCGAYFESEEYMKNTMKFKNGDIVYHKRLKQFGIFIKYNQLCGEECLVKFSDENGYEDYRIVSASQLCFSAEFDISSVGYFHLNI